MKALAACLAMLAGSGCTDAEQPEASPLTLKEFLQTDQYDKFTRALEPFEFEFPRDHGAHPAFKNEWWYITGNLEGNDGRRLGYQFTLFRTAIHPETPDHLSDWATNQLYLAHVAVTDPAAGTFHTDERFARGAVGLSGVTHSPFKAWLENWTLRGNDATGCEGCLDARLTAKTSLFELDLNLKSSSPPVAHGNRGLSIKDQSGESASYYYSYPKLLTEGSIEVNAKRSAVTGKSWFDHEWSTSTLQPDQEGWDWFSLQFSDDSALMLFQLRHQSDPTKHFRSGTMVLPSGQITHLGPNDFDIVAKSTWTSPQSGSTYPATWEITLPDSAVSVTVTPILAAQEHNGSFRYWEGAVDAIGSRGDENVSGRGYVELTGY